VLEELSGGLGDSVVADQPKLGPDQESAFA
jgi:hypothetical protein